jgi:ribosome-binding factor A
MASKSRRNIAANMPSQRQLRVGETLRHALSEILMREEFFDPDLENVSITISEISISPDLGNARVYTMPLGGVNVDVVLPALNRLAPLIQKLVAAKVHLRRVPRLKFYVDNSFETAARMNEVFNRVRQDEQDED